MGRSAIDMPARWVVGLILAGAAASLATIHAGIKVYERWLWPPAPRATEATPVPFSAPRGGIPR